ncbi:ABC transporter permease subunit [Nocardioides sp. B-3]|uniref:ABC transporter permease subunit n=1 Tax=Nocardioides sp. B-3 TaxID=2895565 RepID=UPI0021530917|nr:ATP-binding cassette domain-containing protein [Nocardioides sp. B-3]UUZ57941.1 ATP-binding cassette domain-containing protein [Nocardioides sp. B-3]
MDVRAGEVVAPVGDNGAGKSTLVKVISGVYSPDEGDITFGGRKITVGGPSEARALGIATVFRDLALCDNLDVVANLFLGREKHRGGLIDEVHMEKEAWRLLRTLSAKIPSVRIPIASLSGGQRQTVAIARSPVGNPKIVMLDEPTAAPGVAQTAEVLNLIERLRETGLGRDPDQPQHGRRAGRGRPHRRAPPGPATRPSSASRTPPPRSSSPPSRAPPTTSCPHAPTGVNSMADPSASTVAADPADERLIRTRGIAGYAHLFWNRLRSGELGSLPVVIGPVIICVGFYSAEPRFLSSRSLVSISQFAAPIGIIALGIVLVLLLGEIDLSVGSVSGFTAATMAVLLVEHGQSMLVAILAAMAVGVAIGALYAVLYTRPGVPSFVFSLAGLLGFQGALLYVLGKNGTINLPSDSFSVQFTRFEFLSPTMSYVPVVLIGLLYAGSQLLTIRQRTAAELSTPPLALVLVKAGLLVVGLALLTYYVNIDRGWSYLWLFFVLLVVLMDLALRRTTQGRHVFAVGGNEEAARRSGIKVGRVYFSVFALCSMLAAVGGLLAAGLQTSVSRASGTTDTNLTAIAAAVIGGTSLFGGRGSAYSTMLGIIVLQAIQTGLNPVGVDSSVRFMVTGGVLLLAVAIDSVSRRLRTSSGRG